MKGADFITPFFIENMDVKKEYQIAIDELNVLIPAKLETANTIKEIVEEILDILVEAYVMGIRHASQMVNEETEVSVINMQKAVYQEIEGKTFEDRVVDHIENGESGKLENLVESEYHRVYNTAVSDGVRQTGRSNVTKTWVTMRDNKVRETHDYLEGVTVSADSDFYTYDNDHAPFPGAFEKPENNVNCRCILLYKAE